MRSKNYAQRYLEQVWKLDAGIECKLIEIRQWRELAGRITAVMGTERVSSCPEQDKLAKAVSACVDNESEIFKAVENLSRKKRAVSETIEAVRNPTEYRVLHMRYIQGMSLREIADEFGRDYTWATTCHGRALESVRKILNR